MSLDPRLELLPRFHVRTVAPADEESMLVSGIFSRPEHIGLGDRGWLFVSETESSIADVVHFDEGSASLDVPNWSMSGHVQKDAVFPWRDQRWQARDVAFMLDKNRRWQRVNYKATDAVVFARNTLLCAKCGWTGDPARTGLPACPLCSGELKQVEIFGDQEAAFPLAPDVRFVETQAGFWDHDHCLICHVAIGREEPWGYRDDPEVNPRFQTDITVLD